MCKNPALECKPIDNQIPVEEDNDTSEDEDDESEPTDSDSYYTETSSYNGSDSESDAESASGNRVTPDMVLLLMLKEKGLISEEKYKEKAEECKENIKPFVPFIPRSDSTDTLDYTKNLSGSEAETTLVEYDENYKQKLLEELMNHDDNNEGSEETPERVESRQNVGTVEKEVLQNNETVVNAAMIKESVANDVEEDNMGREKFNEKALHQQAHIETTEKDCNEESPEKSHLEHALNESNQRQPNQETKDQVQQQQGLLENNEKDFSESRMNKKESVETLKQQQILIKLDETKHQVTICENKALPVSALDDIIIVYDELKDGCGKYTMLEYINKMRLITETINEGQSHGHRYNMIRAKISNILNKNETKLEKNSIETNNNGNPNKTENCSEWTKNDSTIDHSKSMDCKTKIEPNLASNKKTKSFKYILRKLVKEGRIIEEKEERISDEYGTDYARVLETYVRGLDDFYENNRAVHLFNEENYNLMEFAMFLNFYSPSSYKYVTETFNTPLPDHKILSSWYLKDDNQPGLTKRAFKILKQKASKKRLTCALMFGDIFLKNHGRCYDQVDYGGGCNYHFTDRAVLAYVFLLVSLDEDWKIPLGYIFARNISAETQAEFIRICLTHCSDAGADVVAVTLETPSPAEYLGCSFQDLNNMKTTFKHPDCDREIAVWIDPCLALKSVRHTLSYKGVLKDNTGEKIRWNLMRKLRKLYNDEDDTIDIDKPGIFELRNHIAKAGLTTEIFSKSLAPALKLCEELMPDLFKDTAPTRKFIYIINRLYDILHSRKTTKLGDVEHRLYSAAKYMLDVFCNEENELSRFDRLNHTPDKKKFKYGYRHFVDGEPACGFIAFLICVESFKHLHATLVEKEQRINSLNPQRLCKVQVEDFVKNIRAYDWSDPDYYSGEDFQGFYNRLFDCIEKKSLNSDQNLALEHWPLQNRYPPAVTIKLTSGKRFYDDIYSAQYRLKKLPKTYHEDRATKLVREYSRAMDTEADLSTKKNMVGYLAGWIAAKFAKCLKCEACIDALCTDKKLWFHTFITSKDVLGVCLPSEEVFRICLECERALKQKGSVRRLQVWVLRRLASQFPWSSHRARHHPMHYIHLARAVISKYIPLRVMVPFSNKDRKRIIDKFSMFNCLTHSELEEEVDGMMEVYE